MITHLKKNKHLNKESVLRATTELVLLSEIFWQIPFKTASLLSREIRQICLSPSVSKHRDKVAKC